MLSLFPSTQLLENPILNGVVQAPTIRIENASTVKPPQELRPVKQDYSPEALKRYVAIQFAKYGIEDEIPIAEAVAACESSWNWQASNGISYGIFQYTPATWEQWGSGDIMNPETQIKVTARLWSLGQQWRWDCWKMLKPF